MRYKANLLWKPQASELLGEGDCKFILWTLKKKKSSLLFLAALAEPLHSVLVWVCFAFFFFF